MHSFNLMPHLPNQSIIFRLQVLVSCVTSFRVAHSSKGMTASKARMKTERLKGKWVGVMRRSTAAFPLPSTHTRKTMR